MKNFGKLSINPERVMNNEELLNLRGGNPPSNKCNYSCNDNTNCDTECPHCLQNGGWGKFCYKSPGL
ncbi:MAG: hypothetical protein C0397_19580 [Odoribacter sp.]|nr:hypothetical protein [Odoribacter sp.]